MALALTQKQHEKAAVLSADVLVRRQQLDQMEAAILELEEQLSQAKLCRHQAVSDYRKVKGSLDELLDQE